MKFKTILTLAAALMASVTFSTADDTPLGKEMSAMNKSLRAVKKNAADATKKAENLEAIAKIKTAIDNSIKLQPKQTEKIPAAEKAAYLEKYKTQMTELGKLIDELKAAIESGNADAQKAVFEKLSKSKETGHKDFGADDE